MIGILLEIQAILGKNIQSVHNYVYDTNSKLIDSILNSSDAENFVMLTYVMGNNVVNFGSPPLWDFCVAADQFASFYSKLSAEHQQAANFLLAEFLKNAQPKAIDILNQILLKYQSYFTQLLKSNKPSTLKLGALFNINFNDVPTTTRKNSCSNIKSKNNFAVVFILITYFIQGVWFKYRFFQNLINNNIYLFSASLYCIIYLK